MIDKKIEEKSNEQVDATLTTSGIGSMKRKEATARPARQEDKRKKNIYQQPKKNLRGPATT